MNRDYKTEYKIVRWSSLFALEGQLNELVAVGWRVDHHKLGAANDVSGWTIYTRTAEVKLPLLERSIKLDDLYRIVNRVLPYHIEELGKAAREMDLAIKQAVDWKQESTDGR